MNNKKILALVLAFAMMFSTISTVFADTTATIGADAEALKTIGVLKGDNSEGVTPAYLAKTTTRMQAAIMFLRLKGLEEEAMAFTGTANFADANTMTWADGKAIMAYLKANPQLGWIGGDGGKFEPFATITAEQYYKVILEALGYKQTTAEVAGDFAWTEVLEFAASKGLTKVASVTNFTNNDLAIATIEGLKANVKDTNTTLATVMVEAGMINKEAAIAAGLYEENTTTAVVESVRALGNNKVLVEFDSAVTKAFAENEANYKAVVKGSTTVLEVKDAVLDGTTQVVLETAAQTAGAAYTLTVGEVSMNFAGVAKDNTVPEIDSVEGTDTNRVVVTFTETMDMATALDAANYSIAGATVEKAVWDDDSNRDSVELYTDGLVANKTYKVAVSNVKSIDLVTIKSATRTFAAKSDKTAPKIDDEGTFVDTNTRMILVFDEEITKESAENLENYKIEVGSTTNTLEVVAAKLVEDKNDLNDDGDDEDMSVVELTTEAQKGSQKYEVHVNNLVDTSVLANKMAKEDTINVYGVRADDDEPEVKEVKYLTSSLIQIKFEDDSRLDFNTLLDTSNYSVNNDITVEGVALVDADDADCKTVRLTVSELGDDSSYKITADKIADEYSNVMDADTTSKTFNENNINKVVSIQSVRATETDEVVITFTDEVDEKTAEDVTNYAINGGIGTPSNAKYDDDAKTVTLTTSDMATNKGYEITINGVVDIAGNTLINVKGKFIVSLDENDIDAPEIEDVEAINKNVVSVTFNEPMDVDNYVPVLNVKTASGDEVTGEYRITSDEEDMTLEFYFATPFADEDAIIVGTTARDIAGNICEDDNYDFSGNSDEAEAVELESWDQESVKEFKLQYNEKVRLQSDDNVIERSSDVPYQLTISIDEDNDSIVWLTANTTMDADKVFELKLADYLENYHDVKVTDSDNGNVTVLETGIEDEDAPYIDEVTVNNRNEIEITYNENLSYEGSYKIEYTDKDGKDKTVRIAKVSAPDDNVVTLTLTDNLEARYNYTLSIVKEAKDLAGNKIDNDAEFDFAGTDVIAIGNYITGVKVLNGTTINVGTFSEIDADDITVDIVYGTENTALEVDFAPVGDDNDEFKVTAKTNGYDSDDEDSENDIFLPKFALAEGTSYTVRIKDKATDAVLYTYKFNGIVDSGVSVDKIGTNYEITSSDAEIGDYVQIITATETLQYKIGDSRMVTVAEELLGGATEADIMVIRNGVVINVDLDVEL